MQLSVLKNLRSDLLSMALLISETLLVNNKGGKMIIIRGRTVMLYYRNNKQTLSTLLRDINLFYWARKQDAIASTFQTIKTRLYHVIKYEKYGCYYYSKMR